MQYLRIKFTNIEPLRIADDSTSQSGQTASLKYIPGSTIRGLIISRLSTREDFESIKKVLFSEKIRFLNAYICNGNNELIPSPKGFYESKSGDGKLSNVVVTGDVSDGMKRAALGNYCSISDWKIEYYSVNPGSDIRNKIMLENDGEKQNVFRYEYIMPGYEFVSYIAIEDESLIPSIQDSIGDEFIIGNSRSTGLGKCIVLCKSLQESTPYGEYAVKSEISNSVYMMLLSDTVMRNEYGEYCGIDTDKLEKKLNVTDLSIERCSTSTVSIRGYNRTIGAKSASITMYEKGSVFKLNFTGKITADTVQKIQNEGIGVRKNEGFGRIIFLSNYDSITSKVEGKWNLKPIKSDKSYAEDEKVLRIVAKNHYRNMIERAIISTVVSNPLRKGALSSSQVGALEARIIANRYNYNEAVNSIQDYYNHAQKKENDSKVQKQRNSIKELKQFVFEVLSSDIEDLFEIEKKETIMGINTKELLSAEEQGRYKLQYLLDAIHFDNRKEGK